MQVNAGQILTNFEKNRTLQDNEGQVLKVRTTQDIAGLHSSCF